MRPLNDGLEFNCGRFFGTDSDGKWRWETKYPEAVIFLFQCEVAPTGSCAECLVLVVLFWGLLETLRGCLRWTESEGIGSESSPLLLPICLRHMLLLLWCSTSSQPRLNGDSEEVVLPLCCSLGYFGHSYAKLNTNSFTWPKWLLYHLACERKAGRGL